MIQNQWPEFTFMGFFEQYLQRRLGMLFSCQVQSSNILFVFNIINPILIPNFYYFPQKLRLFVIFD